MRARLPALALLLALLLPAAPAPAQQDQPRAEADRLMALFVTQGGTAFMDALLAETALGNDSAARRSIQDNRVRWLRELDALGPPVDEEYAGERHYAPSLRTLCYLVRYGRTPLLFSLRFYKAPQRWELLNFIWLTQERIATWECAAGIPTTTP